MKITGYKLQHRLRELAHLRDMAAGQFDRGKHRFEGEDKPTSLEAFRRFSTAENAIARLQTAQAEYNLSIQVTAEGQSMTLCEAVKRVGGAGRMEKMWRSIAAPRRDRYAYGEDGVRNKDEERAAPTISTDEALQQATRAARWASALREAIQVANATERDIDINPELFE